VPTLALGKPGEWDILVGHFLGVDHAGHTFGVESAAMVGLSLPGVRLVTCTILVVIDWDFDC
jgi:hypothetical protein